MKTWNTPYSLWVCSRGFGKALSLDTRIPTPDGDKTIADIQVGDYVFDEAGVPTQVVNVSPIFTNHKCYELEFSDGEKIIADADHLWSVYNSYSRHPKELEVRSTQWLFEHQYIAPRKNAKNWNPNWHEVKFSVPTAGAIQYPEQDLPIHPYILGLWLGDGISSAGYITVSKKDIKETCKNIVECGYKIHSIRNDNRDNKRITIHNGYDISLTTLLRNVGLIQNKHIPEQYLKASVAQRYALLQGMMDTDGYIGTSHWCEFTQAEVHKQIVDGFKELLVGLGVKFGLALSYKKCGEKFFPAYRFTFKCDKHNPCFRMQRKYDRLSDELLPKNKKKFIK